MLLSKGRYFLHDFALEPNAELTGAPKAVLKRQKVQASELNIMLGWERKHGVALAYRT